MANDRYRSDMATFLFKANYHHNRQFWRGNKILLLRLEVHKGRKDALPATVMFAFCLHDVCRRLNPDAIQERRHWKGLVLKPKDFSKASEGVLFFGCSVPQSETIG